MQIDIEHLTIKQARELVAQFSGMLSPQAVQQQAPSLDHMLNMPVIVRTYSAGVWFGILTEKSGNEIILTNARRMWRWWAKESISLSAVAVHGINEEKSKIVEAVPSVWLEAIEIIPCNKKVADQIAGAKNVQAE